ncbi:MAG: hypothetical protein ACM359_24155 [Bacillota bacterium]
MDGIRTAIAGFLLVCLILPQVIKNRHQYYAALVVFITGLFFLVLAEIFSSPPGGFWRFCQVADSVLDIMAFILLVMAAGGLTVRQLVGDLARAYEVMRRGETEKTVIIPRPGQVGREEEDEDAVPRYVINDPPATPTAPPSPPAPGPATEDKGGQIPLA